MKASRPDLPRRRKRKEKSKDTPKDDVPLPEGQDGSSRPSTSTAKPEVAAEEPMPVLALSRVRAEEAKISKKKKKKQKKKEAGLEKFQLEQWEAKAKEMAKTKHRLIQREHDFQAIRNYWKTLPADILETINGADHSDFLLGKLKKEKRKKHKRNLMTVKCQ